MAKKASEAPKTLIAFEFAGRTTNNSASERVEIVTVTARRGEVGYVADVEMQSIEADLLPVIRRIHSVFFKAETEGLPAFPDMEKEAAAAVPPPPQQEEEQEPEYTISFYGDSDSASDESGEQAEHANTESESDDLPDDIEPEHNDDYYAEIADEIEAEGTEDEEEEPADNQYTIF